MATVPQSFGFLRRNFFPIHNHELKKFLPLSLIFFFISSNYALLRGWKDVFVIAQGGSEAIAAVKLWGVLPLFVVFNVIYSYISQRTGRVGRFNIIITYFLIYFGVFALFIYPNRDALQLDAFADEAKRLIPLSSLDGLWTVIRYWPVTLFYIHSEAWGTFALSILFYTFANEIVSTKQSGRFYPFLSVAANIGTILSGLLLMGYFSPISVKASIIFVIFNGILLIVIYTLFSNVLTKNPEKYEIGDKPRKKKKAKLSALESLKVLLNSRYLLLIGFVVFSYAVCINLFEAIYKDYLKEIANTFSPNDTQAYIKYYAGLQLALVGTAAITFSLFLATPAMKMGWRFMGSVSPGMLLLNCGLFLSLLLFGSYFGFIADWLGIPIALFTLLVGLTNVVFIKGSKYTFFDPFKENAYIPLDPEQKLLGKSSIENLSRWGKAAGSLLITLIIKPLGGVAKFRLPLGFIILCIVVIWLWVVQDLTSRFYALTKGGKKAESKGDSEAGQDTKKA